MTNYCTGSEAGLQVLCLSNTPQNPPDIVSAHVALKENKFNGLKELHISMRVKSMFHIKEWPDLTLKESNQFFLVW